MVLEFRLDLQDVIEVARATETPLKRLVRVAVTTAGAIFIVTLISVPLLMKEMPDSLAAFLLGILPLAVLMVILPWYYSTARVHSSHYRKYPFPSCRVEIAENGMRETTESTEYQLSWKSFTSYHENENQYALTAGLVTHILPKRTVDPARIQELAALLKTKIPARIQ